MFAPYLILLVPASAAAANVQLASLTLPADAPTHAAAVRKIFTDAYGTYKSKAWGFDDLAPVSGTGTNSRNGWGATIVDALSTMSIMGLDDLFAEGVEFASKIDFSSSRTEDTVSIFETSIRYLGGLLSAYELSGSTNDALLKKASEVADKMAYAWVGDNAMPYGFLNFSTNEPVVAGSNVAEAGSLVLEWGRLSNLTGNKTYIELAEKSFRHIASANDTLLPAMPGGCVDPTTGGWDCGYITWGGGSDSYFEYLIKYARFTNNANPLWVESWKTAVESTVQNLLVTSDVKGWTFVADYTNDARVRHLQMHLACFIGGNWILGGRMLGNETIVNYGLALVDGCIATYNTSTGIGPEVFAYSSKDGNFTGGADPTAEDLAFYDEHGWYVFNNTDFSYYILRPEVMESNFYAYRATGDERYYQNAVRFIDSLNTSTFVNGANAGINDVRQTDSGFIDDTESFFFAEVLKYVYLTFDDPSHISLDEWVFNTEAHPLKAPPALASYDPSGAPQYCLFSCSVSVGR